MLAVENRAIVDHLGREDVGVVQFLEPLRAGLARKNLVEDCLRLLAMRMAMRGVVVGIFLDMLDAEDAAERGPSFVVDAGNTDVAIGGFESTPDSVQQRIGAASGAFGLDAGERSVIYLGRLDGDHGAIDRGIDALALAGAFACKQSGEDSACEAERARIVRDEGPCD